jgi:hypothetical protein
MSAIKDDTTANHNGNTKHGDAYASCLQEQKYRLLDLAEIFELDTSSDVIFTLKVFYFAFKMATEFSATEYGDLELGSDVLAVCEEKIRHGHTVSLACISSGDTPFPAGAGNDFDTRTR